MHGLRLYSRPTESEIWEHFPLVNFNTLYWKHYLNDLSFHWTESLGKESVLSSSPMDT
jgi:hypothetical protein